MTIRDPQMTIQDDGYYLLEFPPYPKDMYPVSTEILQEYCDLLNERIDLKEEIAALKLDAQQWRDLAKTVGTRAARIEVLANEMGVHFDGLLEDHRECPDCRSSLDAYNHFIGG